MKLLLNTNVKYYNECWSMERFCIIDSNKNNIFWKYLNYNWITTNNTNEIVFGKNGCPYNQHKVFNDILEQENFMYSDIIDTNLILFLKKCIDEKKYILITLYFENNCFLHEILIYGYDFKKKIINYYEPYKKNKLSTIKFEELISLFVQTKKSFKNWFDEYSYRFKYCYPITTISLKANHNINKINILDLFLFVNEVIEYKNYKNDGYIYERKHRTYYDGLLGIINVLFDEFKEYIRGKRTYNFARNIKRYIDYRLFFFEMVDLFFDEKKLPKLINNENQVNNKKLENILLILLKHKEYTEEIIYGICDKLIEINESDYKYILKLQNILHELIINT